MSGTNLDTGPCSKGIETEHGFANADAATKETYQRRGSSLAFPKVVAAGVLG